MCRIKVGFVTPSLYWGGAERWMLDLARFSGHKIKWAGCACVSPQFADDTMIGLFEKLMPVYQSGREAVERVMAEAQVLVAWGAYDLGALAAGFSGPVVFVGHGSGRFDRSAARQAVPGATHYVAVARASLEPFEDLVPPGRVSVLHNGIDPARCAQTIRRQEIRRRLRVRPDEFLTAYLGRMVGEKNPLGLARAVKLLPPRFRAVFVGDGWEVEEQRRQIREVLGDRAILVDRVEDVGNYYRAADAFALLSPREGFSMGMLEAMYCELPCVLTNVGVLPELESEHGRHWEAVTFGRDSQAAEAIHRLAQMPAAERTARASRCRAIVQEHYMAQHMADRWIGYLRRVAASWTPRSQNGRPAKTRAHTLARNAVAAELGVPRWRAAQLVARLDAESVTQLATVSSRPGAERAQAVNEILGAEAPVPAPR